jgi:dolichol-phosphate mannosyltransferase
MYESKTAAGIGGERSPGDGLRLSLVIPAWNEQATISQAIEEAVAALAATTADYEVIIVDDGSTDRTAELVRAAAAQNSHVRLLQQPRNLGYGAALRAGFQAATLDLVAFTDADCQFDLHAVSYMLPLTHHYDIVCGYRIDRQDPPRRRFFSWGYNTLVMLLMGSPVRDLDCALKIFRREKLVGILPESSNFFANTEMLTRARQQGISLVEVGVRHRPRAAGESKVRLTDIPKTLNTLLPFWWSRFLFPGQAPTEKHSPLAYGVALTLLALLAGMMLFPYLSYPLLEPDEGRYAEIGREMAQSGEWIVPTLDGEPYGDKPPMLYWMLASSIRVFGATPEAARLVPALAAWLTILAIFWFTKRSSGLRAGFLSALMLSLTAGFILCGRLLLLDSVLALFVTLGCFSAYEAIRTARFSWGWWLVSAFFCGCGVLTKGPVALVLVAPPVFFIGWLQRLQARPTWRRWAAYLGLSLGLAIPWYIAMNLRVSGFLRDFLFEHHLKRFFSDDYHASPFWYYVPVLFLACMPWTLLFIPLLRFLASRSPAVGALRHPAMGFALLCAGWCLLFFSLSRGKLPPYVLSAVPALAVLVGCYLERVLAPVALTAIFQRVRTIIPQQAMLILGCAWIVLNLVGWFLGWFDRTQVLLGQIASLLCLIGLVAALWWRQRLSPQAAWGLCVLFALGTHHAAFHNILPGWSWHRSPLPLSAEADQVLAEGSGHIACYGREWGSIQFSLGERHQVRNFSKRPPTTLKEYLQQHPRSILIVKSGWELECLRSFLPKDMKPTKAATQGESRIILVRQPHVATMREQQITSTIPQQ